MIETFGDCYRGKTVLVTGHTGFKGSWLAVWLAEIGARVVGYALPPADPRGNYSAARLHEHLFADVEGNILDMDKLHRVIEEYRPEIVFHLAAQALVRPSYADPKLTFETNLLGSVNILEAVRKFDFLKYAVMVTSDKCYENVEQLWGYRETDRMGGFDPYSASKGCAELAIAAYRNSFFAPGKYASHGKAVASVRAGNVVGGGDWSCDRLIPDCVRAIEKGEPIKVRSPQATRPWEHVLEPLSGYLRLGQKLQEEPEKYASGFNFGPPLEANRPVWDVVSVFIEKYGRGELIDASESNAPHENQLLFLDVTKAARLLQWHARLDLTEMLEFTADWYKKSLEGCDMYDFDVAQIQSYCRK